MRVNIKSAGRELEYKQFHKMLELLYFFYQGKKFKLREQNSDNRWKFLNV